MGVCANSDLVVETGFSSARLSSCEIGADGTIELLIAPEDDPPLNCSPWYAFRIRTLDGGTHKVRLKFRYTACSHRYRPKISDDWRDWEPLDPLPNYEEASYPVEIGPAPRYVAAQEILPVATYEQWLEELPADDDIRVVSISGGAGEPEIDAISIGAADAERVVLVLGRQHPPEISGAFGLFAFVETLISDHQASKAFREQTHVIVVPMVNPDGTEKGHWRHNSGGTDLNRDWGKFTQPETRAVQAHLDEVLDRGGKLELLLDFHSTRRDVLYTLPEGTRTRPENFTPVWTAALQRRLPSFSFSLNPGYSAGSGVAKNYFHDRYAVPAITVEFGDETDRGAVARAGQAAALAMFDAFEALAD